VNELHLFAGAGGGILAGQLLGHRCVCAVEWDPYAQAVLVARQNDGCFPPFPIWDDVQTFDGRPWRGIVDVVAGGFPCQDISVAGGGAGITGERSGMWKHMARIVGEVRPRYVFVENSPALITRGLGVVLSDLAALGYDCRWTVLGAADVGAPHQRDRFWLVAHANGMRELQPQRGKRDERGRPCDCGCEVAHADRAHGEGNKRSNRSSEKPAEFVQPSWWEVEPGLDRVVNGMAHRALRLKCIGNGQVPAVAAAAWRFLIDDLRTSPTHP
jgi:DNA (cytosine-5)-methyltransferase 1